MTTYERDNPVAPMPGGRPLLESVVGMLLAAVLVMVIVAVIAWIVVAGFGVNVFLAWLWRAGLLLVGGAIALGLHRHRP